MSSDSMISFVVYNIDDAMRKLKDIQIIIKEEYVAKLKLGYDCYLINIYKNGE